MIPSSLKKRLDAFAIHPRDFANLKAAGKSVGDMSKSQKLISQARNYGRHVVRDARGMRRATRLGSNIGSKNVVRGVRKAHATMTAAGGQVFGVSPKQGGGWTKGKTVSSKAAAANAQAFLSHLATRQSQWKTHGKRFRRKTAMRIGAGALGTAGAIYGVKAFKRYRKKAKEKTRYRDYDVVKTPHGHQAIGRQAYNQPYYNEVEPPAVFGPRR